MNSISKAISWFVADVNQEDGVTFVWMEQVVKLFFYISMITGVPLVMYLLYTLTANPF